MKNTTPKVVAAALLLALAGCAAEDQSKSGDFVGNAASNTGSDNIVNNNTSGSGIPPEEEVEFGFSRPAVIGDRVFVANTDLNSIAVIDAETARITTIPVGFAPTSVVGPSDDGEGGNVFVLNEGASTVTVIGAELGTETFDVGRGANNLAGAPDGSAAVAWYRPGANVDVPTGDLSSVNLVTPEGSFQIAVGFNIFDAIFTDDSSKVLVTSADGVSVIEVAATDDDGIAPPVSVLPVDLEPNDPTRRETILAPDGEYAIARVFGFDGLVLTNLETREQWVTELPEAPSDIDWIEGADPFITANLRARSELLVATIPDGFIAGSELTPPDPSLPPMTGDMDAGSDAGTDAGDSETDDMGMTDPGDGEPVWPEAEGFQYVDLEFEQLGLTEVDRTGSVAFIYTSVANDGRAILLDLETLTQRLVPFEKGILRVESDADGDTFVVIHDSLPGETAGTSPGDPAFIARSNGLSVLDVASGTTRLTLTEEEPQDAVLWAEGDERILYVTFAPPEPAPGDFSEAKRALASIDLRSFALDRTLLPSLPNGLGTIPSAGKIYISQFHPQGRITFVDVTTGRLRTVTGFQLNAGID